MKKTRVLFLCVHNSARSQMAEAFLKKYGDNEFEVMSAGIEPGNLSKRVVAVMKEIDIDISQNKTKSVFDLYKRDLAFQYVIAVCAKEAADKCPVFIGVTTRLHWPFDDPSSFCGSEEEIMKETRRVRDEIEEAVKNFVKTISERKPFKESF